MKLIGILFVVLSCTALGVIKAQSLARENETYTQLIASLMLIKGEICSRATAMDEVFGMLNVCKGGYASAFFSQISDSMANLGDIALKDMWCSAAETLGISSDGVQALKALGNIIGRYDVQIQESAIERCILTLSAEQRKVKDSLGESKRMYIGIGAASGLMLAILLI